MLPISLLLWLVAELAAYHLLAGLLFGLQGSDALLAAGGTLLANRAAINLTTWLIAARHASPGYPANPGRRLWLIVQDYLAYLFSFFLVIPFRITSYNVCYTKLLRPMLVKGGNRLTLATVQPAASRRRRSSHQTPRLQP